MPLTIISSNFTFQINIHSVIDLLNNPPLIIWKLSLSVNKQNARDVEQSNGNKEIEMGCGRERYKQSAVLIFKDVHINGELVVGELSASATLAADGWKWKK